MLSKANRLLYVKIISIFTSNSQQKCKYAYIYSVKLLLYGKFFFFFGCYSLHFLFFMLALGIGGIRLSSHVTLTPLSWFLCDIFSSHPEKSLSSHLLLYQHCGKWCQSTLVLAFARFSFMHTIEVTHSSSSTCDKVWNASFKFNHISELPDTYTFAEGFTQGFSQ